tara:strand:- start:160 stop:417 length:258 start_codon:yes stop_codon:yes gene_type:complete
MTLDTDRVRMHWSDLAEHLKIELPKLIEKEIKYWVFETSAAGKCPDDDEFTLVEILSDMAEWKILVSYDVTPTFGGDINHPPCDI